MKNIIISLPEKGRALVLQTSSHTIAFSNLGIILVGKFCYMFLSLLVFPFISVILLDLKFNTGYVCNHYCIRISNSHFYFSHADYWERLSKLLAELHLFLSLVYFFSGLTENHVSRLDVISGIEYVKINYILKLQRHQLIGTKPICPIFLFCKD